MVQATEVTYWDFLKPMSQEDYDYPASGGMVFSVPIDDPFAVAQVARAGKALAKPHIGEAIRVDGQIAFKPTARPFAVDEAKLHGTLLNKIRDKARHYTMPNDGSRLWLLIWTVCSGFIPFWNEGGKPRVSPGITLAHASLAETGSGPFDEVWFMSYIGPAMHHPRRIWPPE